MHRRPIPTDRARFRSALANAAPKMGVTASNMVKIMERARRFERPTPTLARLCSTPELRPLTGAQQIRQMPSLCWGGGQLAAVDQPRKRKITQSPIRAAGPIFAAPPALHIAATSPTWHGTQSIRFCASQRRGQDAHIRSGNSGQHGSEHGRTKSS